MGKRATYLGMDIEFIDDGAIEISMPQHITEAIEAFGEKLTGTVS